LNGVAQHREALDHLIDHVGIVVDAYPQAGDR